MMADKGYRAIALLLCTACLATVALNGCSDSTTQYRSSASGTTASGDDTVVDASGAPVSTGSDSPLVLLQDDPGLLHDLPEVMSTQTLADSGLRVAYTTARQLATIDAGYIGLQWQYMQTCTGVNAPAPYVVIVDGSVSPFVATDDVIRDLGGQSLATSSFTGEGTIVQISASDLDGSFGETGFSLRAIFGRSLWLGANLSLRDYPFACASTEPAATDG